MRAIHEDETRPPAVADMFYPGDPQALARQIDAMLADAEITPLAGDIKALVAPHAGYVYSGPVAAAGYKHIIDRAYSVIAVISPSHRDEFPGVSVFNGKGYETPLGLFPVARELANALIDQGDIIRSSWQGHEQEHALEVQLPFLARVAGDAQLIPIVMGDQTFGTCKVLGEALAEVLAGERALVVASSDLSHYHPYDEAVAIDSQTIDLVESFDAAEFMTALADRRCEACGGGPIAAAMIASKGAGANAARSLLYRNSGDTAGERATVVGYLSAAFYQMN